MSVVDALNHEYVRIYHVEEEEPSAPSHMDLKDNYDPDDIKAWQGHLPHKPR